MHKFSPKMLIARHAILSGTDQNASIQILMAPFLLNAKLVDASICLDAIELPSTQLYSLADKSFEFPLNPVEGYIDGSIYLEGKHHPVDVSSISFSRSRSGQLTLLLKGVYVFEFEGLDDLKNTPFTLATTISSSIVPD